MRRALLRAITLISHALSGAAGVCGVGVKALVFHNHAVRRYQRAIANVGAVKQNGVMTQRRAAANVHVVNFQNAVLETVRLKVAVHRGVVANGKHVGINHLRESAAKHHALANAHANYAQKVTHALMRDATELLEQSAVLAPRDSAPRLPCTA